ncbi:MAG: hypothetical protein RLY93_04830 [Sumerlaeia bacterium]
MPLSAAVTLGALVAAVAGGVLWFLCTGANPLGGYQALLLHYMLFMMLALGGVVFAAIQYVASARWSIVVRRLAEGMAAFLPIAFLVFLLLWAMGGETLYHSEVVRDVMTKQVGVAGEITGATEVEVVRPDFAHELHHSKAVYLSHNAMLIKGIVYYAIWLAMAFVMIKVNSVDQDKKKDPAAHNRNKKLSIAFLILFAATFSLHSLDMLSALEARFFSTMFGVYTFAGLFLSTLAVLTMLTHYMRRRSPAVREVIQERHIYDLGTWMMAFSVFMIYIGFSQYMLIWYANLPEETFYMIHRTQNGWEYVFALLPFLKWFIPFAVLMPQPFRANPKIQIIVALAILTGQWFDLYWMIYPVFSKAGPFMTGAAGMGALLGSFLALFGLFALATGFFFKTTSPLAVGDPHILSSANGSYL